MDVPRRTGLFWGGCLGILGIFYLYLRKVFSALPFEDAAILMRYVDHLANGEGIVWNIGEAPVDGATDFFFVLAAASLQSLGLSTELAVQTLNVLSYLGTVFLVYESWRAAKFSTGFSVLVAVCVILGPAYAYIEAYFGTTFFAFFGSWLAYLSIKLIRSPESRLWAILFGIVSLLLGLARPEGVFLSFFILVGLIFNLKRRQARFLIKNYLVFLLGIGSLYLIWRYLYFGHLLPNPFYKKGGAFLYPASLLQSFIYTFRLLFPLTLLILILKPAKIHRAQVFYLFSPILGFASIWVFLSSEMNYLMRFQYVLFPITLINLSVFWVNERPKPFSGNTQSIFSVLLVLMMCAYYSIGFKSTSANRDGRYEVAKILNPYNSYKLASTEAGLLPYYSKWPSLDTWGLNDHKIAKEGVIGRKYLADFDPDLILFDAFAANEKALRGSIWDNYGDMIDTLRLFITQNNYKLIAKFPDPAGKHAHYYFVKGDIPDADSISYKIRNCPYYWYEDGQLSKPEFGS